MKEIPYFFILECVTDWRKGAGKCIDCDLPTPFYVRHYRHFLCISCYRRRAQANTLGEVCCAAPDRG